MTNEELLLKEDQDLLKKFDEIGPRASTHAEEQNEQMLRIQIESTMRSRKTMIDLDASNSKVQEAVLGLAFIQIFIPVIQYIFDTIPMDPRYVGAQSILKIVLYGAFVTYMFATVFKKPKTK